MDPDCLLQGQKAGGGRAHNLRRPSRRLVAPPSRKPSCHPHSTHRWLGRPHAVGSLLAPHIRSSHAQKTRATGTGHLLKGGAAGRGRMSNPRPPGREASRPHEDRPGLGFLPLPAARPWGRQAGSAAHMLWARVSRRGDPAHWRYGLHPLLCVARRRGGEGFLLPL